VGKGEGNEGNEGTENEMTDDPRLEGRLRSTILTDPLGRDEVYNGAKGQAQDTRPVAEQ
jgi:hypothetical protein